MLDVRSIIIMRLFKPKSCLLRRIAVGTFAIGSWPLPSATFLGTSNVECNFVETACAGLLVGKALHDPFARQEWLRSISTSRMSLGPRSC